MAQWPLSAKMGKSYDGKKRWNETVRQTTAALAASHRRSSGNAGHKAAAKHGKRLSGAWADRNGRQKSSSLSPFCDR